jgi:hypothetical protein
MDGCVCMCIAGGGVVPRLAEARAAAVQAAQTLEAARADASAARQQAAALAADVAVRACYLLRNASCLDSRQGTTQKETERGPRTHISVFFIHAYHLGDGVYVCVYVCETWTQKHVY